MPEALLADSVLPEAPAWVGVPLMVAIPSLLYLTDIPAGGPMPARLGAGDPVAVTVKVPNWPTLKTAVSGLVNTGPGAGKLTVKVKVCPLLPMLF